MNLRTERVSPRGPHRSSGHPRDSGRKRGRQPPGAAGFEQAPCGLVHLDLKGCFLQDNRRFRELVEVDESEVLKGTPLDDFTEADTMAMLQQQLQSLRSGEVERTTYECDLIGRGGRRVTVTLRASMVVNRRGTPQYYALVVDEAERRRENGTGLDYGVRQWKERYDLALGAVRQVVYERDLSGNGLLMSGSIQELLGRPPVSGGWRQWVLLIHPDDRLAVERQHLSATPGQPYQIEYRIFREDGRVATVREEGMLLETAGGGERRRLVAVLTDISGQQDLALQLQHAQKMEVFGRLAGGVAHDFNNLLTVFTGYTDMLIAELEPDHACHEYLTEMQRAAERATALTSQLLAFGRMQRSRPCLIRPGEVLQDLRKMLRRLIGEDIELVTHVAEGVGMVRADPRQIETVLINLAVNARDAMPHGGRLSIDISNTLIRPGDPRVRTGWQPGPYVEICVGDTGIGMARELCDRAFEPFFTTKPPGEGTGLGLSTCYGIVEQSGGHIAVESTPGQGSCFRIYLPRVRSSEAPVPLGKEGGARPPETIPRGKGETILLVEDDLAVRKIYSTMLRRLGYQVLCGSNGDEALRIVREHPEIGLVITDLVMPFMSGIDLAEELRHTSPQTKVVLISGYASEPENLNSARDIPFLAKPLSRDILACTLRELLETA